MTSGLWPAVAVLVVAACDDPAGVAPPADQTTADCAAPTYATDMLVCDDPDLRALDAKLAQIWAQAEARSGGDPAAADEQAAWFRERSLCAFQENHRACAESAYRARIAALQAAGTSP